MTTMNVFSYPIATAGEAVYLFLRDWLRKGASIAESFVWLEPLYRAEEWREYMEQFVAVSLTGQLVAGGRTFREWHGHSAPFATAFRAHLNDTVTIDKDSANKLFRMATSAVDESRRGISTGLATRLRQWAVANHDSCYLCGALMDFSDPQSERAYTADHIWPQSYGGDSVDDNLLPACRVCNSHHKGNFATWAMTSVQSVIYGIQPSPNTLSRAPGAARFALHHRRVQSLAIKAKIPLKTAYLRIGPSEELRTQNNDEVAHFFNLANHDVAIDVQ